MLAAASPSCARAFPPELCEEGNQVAAQSVQRRLGLAGDFGAEVACGPLSETGFGGVEEAWNVMGQIRV